MVISTSNQMKTGDLPPKLLATLDNTIKKINKKNSTPVPLGSPAEGAADYFTYKINIQDGSKTNVIEYNEYILQNDVRSLVNYVMKD
jgi:hypothetical protein